MKNLIILFFSFFVALFSYAQKDSAALVKEIQEFRKNLNKEYNDPAESPLSKEERKAFKQINFFPVNLQYVVVGKFIRTPNEKIFGMPTSGKIKKDYVKDITIHYVDKMTEVIELALTDEVVETGDKSALKNKKAEGILL